MTLTFFQRAGMKRAAGLALAVSCLACCNVTAGAQEQTAEFPWLVRAGGKTADKARGLTADRHGNSYLTGEFSGTADFGEFTLTSRGERDIFIAGYDPQGRCRWARQAGGSKTDRGYGIAVDDLGHVYVTGHYESDDATFGEETPIPNSGGFGVFFAKYDGDGELLWVRHGGSDGYDTAQGVAIGPDGLVYFTGGLRGREPGRIAGSALRPGSRNDLFLVCFDSAGTLQWLRQSSGPGAMQGRSIAVDPRGDVLVGGFGSGGKQLGDLSLPAKSVREPFVVAWDSQGRMKWSWHAGGESNGLTTAVALDGTGGAYAAGSFQGTMNVAERSLTSRGESDFYVARLDSSGNPVWIRHGGGSGTDYALDMVAGPEGDCYVTGELSETILLETGSEPLSVTSAGGRDLYLARFAPDGTLRRFVQSGGERNDLAYAVGVDAAGNAYITGAFDSTTHHGPHRITSRGRNDVFLLKITPH